MNIFKNLLFKVLFLIISISPVITATFSIIYYIRNDRPYVVYEKGYEKVITDKTEMQEDTIWVPGQNVIKHTHDTYLLIHLWYFAFGVQIFLVDLLARFLKVDEDSLLFKIGSYTAFGLVFGTYLTLLIMLLLWIF